MSLMTKKDLDGTILACGVTIPLDSHEDGLNRNIALVGAPGRGKTHRFIKPNIMQMNSNYVIADTTGRLALELGTMLKNNGYNIKVLNLVDLKHSDMYNPLSYLESDADVMMVTDYLLGCACDDVKGVEPKMCEGSRALISALILYLFHECRPTERTFTNVMKLLRAASGRDSWSGKVSPLDNIFADLQKKDPEHIAVRQYEVIKEASDNLFNNIVSASRGYLQNFNLSEYENITNGDTLQLQTISSEKTALFVIASDTDSSKEWLARLFYNQLFNILSRQNNKLHIRFCFDDFSTIAIIPDFPSKMSMFNHRNLSCIISLRDEAQLEGKFSPEGKTILSNCDTYVFMGSTNIDSCADAARRLNKKAITAGVIKNMGTKKCVIVHGAIGGIYKKFNVENHLQYQNVAEHEDSPLRYNLEEKHHIVMPPHSKTHQRKRTCARRCPAHNSRELDVSVDDVLTDYDFMTNYMLGEPDGN